MTGTRQLKSVSDIRTPLSGHIHSMPPREDSAYLQGYLLRKEQERLGAVLGVLTKRQRQIQGRLEEIRAATEKLLGKAPGEPGSNAPAETASEAQTAEGKRSQPGRWPTMTLEY